MTQRVVLFIDEKIFYKGARRAFFNASAHFTYGNFNPIALGKLICARLPDGEAEARTLHQVRVYTGRPDSTREPKSYAAHMKQCARWENSGAVVIARTLRYPPNWQPFQKAEQKGVDVALAVEFVVLAIEGQYDVGIVASTDSDLRPALEFVRRKFARTRKVEVASWWSPRSQSRLSVPRIFIWCHWLSRQDYNSVADLADYTV